MDAQDALFEDLQALSDDADALGLVDVAMVLEFAMDVFLREAEANRTDAPLPSEVIKQAAENVDLTPPERRSDCGWSMSSFPLAQLQDRAS